MIRRYKVLCGKWETIIEVERREWLFNALVQKLKILRGNRKVTVLPLGFSIGIIEIGDKGEEKGEMFFPHSLSVFEAAGFYKK